jgi:hypothetical protein
MGQELADILDECLERILRGESAADCLKAYPEQASQLKPLLETSVTLFQQSSAIQPTAEFKAEVYSRIQALLRAKEERAIKRARIPIWHRRWAMAAVTVLLILLAGAGTITASANALPDESLYPVKLATERLRLTTTFSDIGEAKLHIQFAERRATEIAAMARQGEDDKIPTLTLQLGNHLEKVCELEKGSRAIKRPTPKPAPPAPLAPAPELKKPPNTADTEGTYGEEKKSGELATILTDSRSRSLAALGSALQEAPPKAKPSLQQAIADITADYEATLSVVGQ